MLKHCALVLSELIWPLRIFPERHEVDLSSWSGKDQSRSLFSLPFHLSPLSPPPSGWCLSLDILPILNKVDFFHLHYKMKKKKFQKVPRATEVVLRCEFFEQLENAVSAT